METTTAGSDRAGDGDRPGIFTGSELLSQGPVKMVRHCSGMSSHPERPSRTSANRGAGSRDAGLQRIRILTRGAAVTAAVGSIGVAVVLAQAAQSQAASSGANSVQAAAAQAVTPPPAAASSSGNDQQPLAPPPQPPAAADPQAQPQAVSGGS